MTSLPKSWRVRGLLDEIGHAVVLVGRQDAEAAGLLDGDGHDGDRRIRIVGLVGADHRVVVHLVDVVARQHHDVFGRVAVDEADVLIDGVGRSRVPAALIADVRGRRQAVGAARVGVQVPRRTVADVAVQHERLVLGQHAHGLDARVGAIRKREIDDSVLATVRHCRLRPKTGEHPQAASLATRQDHGHAFLVIVHVSLLCSLSLALARCRRLPSRMHGLTAPRLVRLRSLRSLRPLCGPGALRLLRQLLRFRFRGLGELFQLEEHSG